MDAATFDAAARDRLGVEQVINFYGMAEQVGSVFFENPGAGLQSPVFAHVIVRDQHTLRPLPAGRRGPDPGALRAAGQLPRPFGPHRWISGNGWAKMPRAALGLAVTFTAGQPGSRKAEARGCSDTYEQRS